MIADLVSTGAVVALYAPALRFALVGDDYQWLQLAHRALHRPLLLLSDLDTFYRPTSTWTLALDRLLAGHRAFGYHLTNLLLHAAAGVGLALAARRLGLGPGYAWAAGLLWAASPFTEEPAVAVAIRFEDLLALAWLVMVAGWPKPTERWSRWRVAMITSAVVFAALSKETWVVTPALIAALELVQHRSGRRAALPIALAAAAALVYVAVYFVVFPGDKAYYQLSLAPLAKVPHELAAFLHLEGLVPLAFTFTRAGAVAMAMIIGLAILGFRWQPQAAAVGVALLIAPTLPTLLVPYLPTRYTAVPYAGFLLLAAAVAQGGVREVTPRRRPIAVAGATALGLLVLVSGAVTVRADLVDGARLSQVSSRLLREAEAVAPAFPLGRPVLVLRAEANNPARDIMMSPHGLPKLIFTRHPDPDGLIDAAALFEWALNRAGVAVKRYDDGEERFRGQSGAILEHRRDGFVWLTTHTPDIGAAAQAYRHAGIRYRLIEAEPLSR